MPPIAAADWKHNRMVMYRRKTGGVLAPCHIVQKLAAFVENEPCIKSMHSTNCVCHGRIGCRGPMPLKVLPGINARTEKRFPNIRVPMRNPTTGSCATVMVFSNGKTVSNGNPCLAEIYALFVQAASWVTRNLRMYDEEFNDLYFTRFVTVNNPHTGTYAYPINTLALRQHNGVLVRSSDKFKAYAMRIGRCNTSVFKNNNFIVTGGRDSDETIATIKDAIKVYKPYMDMTKEVVPSVKAPKVSDSRTGGSKRNRRGLSL